MVELRERVARIISDALGEWDAVGVLPRHTTAADAILAIPEIEEALALATGDHEAMGRAAYNNGADDDANPFAAACDGWQAGWLDADEEARAAITVLSGGVSITQKLADELERLLPFLQSHHHRVDGLAGLIAEARAARSIRG